VLRYDTRGHGRSDAPKGPYTLDQLVGDVIGLLDTLGIKRAHYCGLSMGGLTGIALAARHPERFERVVLSNTAALIGSDAIWTPRAAKAREEGGMSAPSIPYCRVGSPLGSWWRNRCCCRVFATCSATRRRRLRVELRGHS